MRRWLAAGAVALIVAGGLLAGRQEAEASDPAGVYAILDEVTIEPGGDGPAVLRASGLFCVANGRYGGEYHAPRPGSIAVTIAGTSAERVAQQMNDLRAAAGTGKVVAFGGRHGDEELPTVAPPGAAAPQPVSMAHGIGVRTIESARYGPVAHLQTYPRIVGPSGDVPFEVHRRYGAMGNVQITVRNPALDVTGYRLLFETERATGDIVASGPVEPGADGRTTYERWMSCDVGETVRFRVRVVHDELPFVSVATGSFRVVEKAE